MGLSDEEVELETRWRVYLDLMMRKESTDGHSMDFHLVNGGWGWLSYFKVFCKPRNDRTIEAVGK